MDDLPEEILLNILHRLPVKAIGLCMCVKKDWISLLKNPSFVSLHTKIKNSFSRKLVIWRSETQFELHVDNDRLDSYKLFNLPSGGYSDLLFDDEKSIPNCYGMICIIGPTIMLWNPIIRKLLTLPQPSLITPLHCRSYSQHLGFWFDSLKDDYNLIRILCFRNEQQFAQVEIFSLNENCWRTICETCTLWFQILACQLPVINSTLHYTAYYGHRDEFGRRDEFSSILSFDVNAKVFGKIELPNVLRRRDLSFTLAQYKETSIAICCDYVKDVWVMKEYGNVDSWTKIWNFDETQDPFNVAIHPDFLPRIIGFLNNGEILWQLFFHMPPDTDEIHKMIMSIDPKNGKKRVLLVIPWRDYRVPDDSRYFEESLALLDNANAVTV